MRIYNHVHPTRFLCSKLTLRYWVLDSAYALPFSFNLPTVTFYKKIFSPLFWTCFDN